MTVDPFETLAQPIVPDMPRRLFADGLRARLDFALSRAVAPSTTNAATERNPAMTQTITPYLCVDDAAAAIEWYRTYFNAGVTNVIPWEGRIGHSELEFGGATFYLSDPAPQLGVLPPAPEGTSSSFVVLVSDVDAWIARAESGGAVLERGIDEAHGSRNGWIKDPFGHRWNVGTPLVDPEQRAGLRRPSEPYYMTVSTNDVEQAAAFYGAVLDWQFSDPNPSGGRHVVNTKFPFGLRPTKDQFADTQPGEVQMWFTVRDFDDALDRVRAAGGTVLTVNSYSSGREARCEDDQGVLFRLSEPAPGYDTA